jgi:predicted O-methyltransferase YrrM
MNSITIDSTGCRSDLCVFCAELGTDKSPYGVHGHRHPYTAPYSLLFEPLRKKPIKFAEIGVFRGASLCAWRRFFTSARIFGFDNDVNNLNFIARNQWPQVYLDVMDASKASSIQSVLQKYVSDGELFDVILDDASHDPPDQMQVIRTALQFLKPGGLLIVEDVFRERPTQPYEEVFAEIQHLVSFHTFIVCDHENRYSPGWNNDKLLVFVKA